MLKISGFEEVIDCKRKGEIFFMVGSNFQRDFVIIKKGEIEEVSSVLKLWPGCFDDNKVQKKKKKGLKMKKL